MISIKTAIWFFVRASVVFSVLSLPLWFLGAPVYRTMFGAEIQSLTAIITKVKPSVTFEVEAVTPENNSLGRDFNITLFNHKVHRLTRGKTSSYFIGFMPIIAVVALVVATPMPRFRMLRSLAWGVLWINVFVVFRLIALFVLLYVGTGKTDPKNYWENTGQSLSTVMNDLPTVSFGAAIIVWVIVVFKDGAGRFSFGKEERG